MAWLSMLVVFFFYLNAHIKNYFLAILWKSFHGWNNIIHFWNTLPLGKYRLCLEWNMMEKRRLLLSINVCSSVSVRSQIWCVHIFSSKIFSILEIFQKIATLIKWNCQQILPNIGVAMKVFQWIYLRRLTEINDYFCISISYE